MSELQPCHLPVEKKDIQFHRKLAEPCWFNGTVLTMANQLSDWGVSFTKIAAIEALGMPLGGGLAFCCSSDLILIRKDQGDVPSEHLSEYERSEEFEDHTGQKKRFRVFRNAFQSGDKVLLVDEHSETIAQIRAAARLIQTCHGQVVGIALVSASERARYVLRRANAPCPVVIITKGGDPWVGHTQEWEKQCDSGTYW